jgi:anti-sigma B factor antagonist
MTQYVAAGFTVTELDRDGGRTLSLAGELDIASAPTLEAAIVRIHAESVRSVTIDLTGLTFMDSTGLHAIVYADQLYKRLGYRFALLPGPPAVQRLFEITGLIDVLTFAAGGSSSHIG